MADNPFEILQKLLCAENREQLWEYVQSLDDKGTVFFRVRGIQMLIKANRLEGTEAWQELCEERFPLGMAGSTFRKSFPQGQVTISPRDATLEEAHSHLAALIALRVDSKRTRTILLQTRKRQA